MNRKARDRRIAEEIAAELYEALGPAMPPEALTANGHVLDLLISMGKLAEPDARFPDRVGKAIARLLGVE
jgi:hypothetical protein